MIVNSQDLERLLVFLSTGLVELHDQTLSGVPIRSPYPKPLQQGLHKLAAIQLDHNSPLICGLQDLLNLAHQSFSSWNIEMPEELASPSDKLLDHGLPTNFCLQWVHEQGVDAHEQEQLLPKVIEICRQAEQPEVYSYFRAMLIQEPVIDAMHLQEVKMESSLRLLANELGEAYIPAPFSAAQDGVFMLCKHCNGLLLRVEGGEFQCENERCRSKGIVVGNTIRADTEVLWLTSGLRRYVAQPGLAEIELRQSLEALGVIVEMWPNFDAYDLRVTVVDEVWAIDVKDWANPFLLARQAKSLRQKPRWDRAFYIFPDERQRQRADYLRAFKNHWQSPPKTKALMQSEFLREVRQKLEGA
jgi:hypothetical protein